MTFFDEANFSLGEFSGVVRLFPLPNLVMLPHTLQPLHVFEPRYRDLVAAALATDRLIAMAVLAPGWEADYEGRPRVLPYACLGKVLVSRSLPDGTHDLLVAGLRRVRLMSELPATKSYREARAFVCEDVYARDEGDRRRLLQGRLRELLARHLSRWPHMGEHLAPLVNSTVSFGALTDILGCVLELGRIEKEALLSQPDVCRRAERLLGYLATAAEDRGVRSDPAGFPPGFSRN